MSKRLNCIALCALGLILAAGCAADTDTAGPAPVAVQEITCGRTRCMLANATATCHRGKCVIATCDTFRADCNFRDGDGCEVNIGTDVRNCGGCGTVCPHRANATATCTQGACGSTCNAGFADCDGVAANGCETNLNTDATHCGACTNTCGTMVPPGYPPPPCCAGRCTNTAYDLNNCGGCGVVCPARANAQPTCNYPGTCAFYCNYPYGDCNGVATDGCETNIGGNDNNNCGGCGIVCTGGATCQSGRCVLTCPQGQLACYNPMTGGQICTDVSSDPANCGNCGFVCASGATCASGVCSGSCPAGFGDCDHNPMNGCETNLGGDPANCGACGRACPTGLACSSGMCVPPCPTGLTSCRGRCFDLNSDPNNCGACGTLCMPGTTCVMGRCG